MRYYFHPHDGIQTRTISVIVQVNDGIKLSMNVPRKTECNIIIMNEKHLS